MKNLIFVFFFLPTFAFAQKAHTVAPKETLYSLARQYNITPKELAAYNNISITTGLTIGQVINIPGKATTSPVKNTTAVTIEPVSKRTENFNEKNGVAIYHKVEKKETLYHISKLYPGLTVADIKKWNNLVSDGVSEGTNLIVGYQKGNKAATISPVVVKDVPETKTVITETQQQPVAKEKVIITEKPVAVETKPNQSKTVEPSRQEINKVTGKSFGGGYFKSLYNETASSKKDQKEETGTAAIFKSTSGWEDGKYYCLHNAAPAGAIVKITNKNTQKTVYAKVLDVIPDLKQNSGILIRLSNAAADELGAGESNFEAVLNY